MGAQDSVHPSMSGMYGFNPLASTGAYAPPVGGVSGSGYPGVAYGQAAAYGAMPHMLSEKDIKEKQAEIEKKIGNTVSERKKFLDDVCTRATTALS